MPLKNASLANADYTSSLSLICTQHLFSYNILNILSLLTYHINHVSVKKAFIPPFILIPEFYHALILLSEI